jgi:hypothetical protein
MTVVAFEKHNEDPGFIEAISKAQTRAMTRKYY